MIDSSVNAAAACAIRAVDLVKAYGGAPPVVALGGVSLEIKQGERVALLGKSGSGKSTLLNLLGGLDRPTSGQLSVAGAELGRLSSGELARFRSQSVGIIFQSFNLISSRSALDNVALPLVFAGVAPRQRRAAAAAALEAVGLGARMHHRPAQLSGGETQRVAVARALVNRPPILLADEPTGNLDSGTARTVIELVSAQIAERGATLVLVTHDEELAQTCTDRVIRLKDGQIVD